MTRRRTAASGLTAVGALAAVGVYLFRASMVDNSALGLIRLHRSWGAVTRATVDSHRDGRIDGEYFYSWKFPYSGAHGNEAVRYRNLT